MLKSLNRQAQRKILKQVDKIRSSYGMTGKKTSNEENTGQEPEGKVEELREALETSTAELDGLKVWGINCFPITDHIIPLSMISLFISYA